jgi:hypothetical protein
MDSEPYKQRNNEIQQDENSDPLLDGRNVLPTTRLRCSSTNNVEANKFVFDYHFVFLPVISLILWGIYVFI